MMAGTRRRRALAALAGTATIVAIAWAGWSGYRAVVSQPVERVSFAGDLERLRASDLEALASAIRGAGHVSLDTMREAARRVPWVRDATVRRAFPDGAEITFEAHEAFAHWNDGQLVSPRGEVFTADYDGALPRLRGPDGAAGAMVAGFGTLAASLAPLGSPLVEVRLSPRGAWQVVLANGLTLELGRGDTAPRVARLVAAWPQVAERVQAARHADLRYPNGFAIAMKK